MTALRRFCPIGLWCVLLLSLAQAADETKTNVETKPEPPQALLTLPLALKWGTTNKVVIRGLNLTNVSELRFTNAPAGVRITLGAAGKADVPKETDAKKVGDTQVTADIYLPAGVGAGTNWYTLISPAGVSVAKPLAIYPDAELLEEKEPNGGFGSAQALLMGQVISGLIKESGDVDVFRFDGRAGQGVVIDVWAADAGSPLDSIVTLYDVNGHLLASNDDSHGSADSTLYFKLPAAGAYFCGLVDAGDKGSALHAYLVRVSETPESAPTGSGVAAGSKR